MLILAATLLAQATTAPVAAPAATDRQVCRRIETTGSRVQARRVCMTAREWRGAGDAARSLKQTMQDLTGGAPREF